MMAKTMSAEQARYLLDSLHGADLADGCESHRAHVVAVTASTRRPLNVYTVRGTWDSVGVADMLAGSVAGDVVLYALDAAGELVTRDLSVTARDAGVVTVRHLLGWSAVAAVLYGVGSFAGAFLSGLGALGGAL